MKSPLSQHEKGFALQYRAVTHCTLREALRFSKKYYKDYLNYISKRSNYIPVKRETNIQYIYNEFIFQGFVPESEFKKKRHRHYIISNRPILGEVLIYPVHAWHSIDHRKEGEPYIYDLLNQIGVEGYTRVDLLYKL